METLKIPHSLREFQGEQAKLPWRSVCKSTCRKRAVGEVPAVSTLQEIETAISKLAPRTWSDCRPDWWNTARTWSS
jgi:hypothetical protein